MTTDAADPNSHPLVIANRADIEQANNDAIRLRTGQWRMGEMKKNQHVSEIVIGAMEQMAAQVATADTSREEKRDASKVIAALVGAHVTNQKNSLEIGELDVLADRKPASTKLPPPPQVQILAPNATITSHQIESPNG